MTVVEVYFWWGSWSAPGTRNTSGVWLPPTVSYYNFLDEIGMSDSSYKVIEIHGDTYNQYEIDSEGRTPNLPPGTTVGLTDGKIGTVLHQQLHWDSGESFFGNVLVETDDGRTYIYHAWMCRDLSPEVTHKLIKDLEGKISSSEKVEYRLDRIKTDLSSVLENIDTLQPKEMTIFEDKGVRAFFNCTQEVKDKTLQAIVSFLKEYRITCGETLVQSDNTTIYAPELLRNICDEIMNVQTEYK